MPALIRRLRRTALAASTAVLATALLQAPASAGGLGDLGPSVGGGGDGANITATAGVQYNKSNNGTPSSGHPAGPLKPVGNWKPPACWYEPYYTPAQLKAEREGVWAQPSVGNEWVVGQRDHYVNGQPYTDFNMDKTGKGYWWYGYVPNPGAPGWDQCQDPPFWVDKGDTPPAAHHNVITPEVLAELAYNQILIPTGDATINPAGDQGVNIPTWVWMDPTVFHPVSVTAYLPDYNVSATTTAKPVGIRIEPHTPYAQTYPASGNCAGTGRAWKPGAGNVPPCGVVFLKDSGNGTYTMDVTVRWQISWTGTGHPNPTALPTGTFTSHQTVTVREIQSVNR
ncbi:hypothetical protein [Streptomyces sp. NPDC020983]|uniref:hypothetical protein n=1 Tax=Streptomyces sp. NPDC020983 TaxID=3365106 RepID=UPI0037A9EF3F